MEGRGRGRKERKGRCCIRARVCVLGGTDIYGFAFTGTYRCMFYHLREAVHTNSVTCVRNHNIIVSNRRRFSNRGSEKKERLALQPTLGSTRVYIGDDEQCCGEIYIYITLNYIYIYTFIYIYSYSRRDHRYRRGTSDSP